MFLAWLGRAQRYEHAVRARCIINSSHADIALYLTKGVVPWLSWPAQPCSLQSWRTAAACALGFSHADFKVFLSHLMAWLCLVSVLFKY
ncbi:hypothetical protein BDV11DRAFT_177426 [Aspergillus similis]